MTDLNQFADAKLQALAARNLQRQLSTTEILDERRAVRDGRRLIVFCSNDYLNLSQNARVKARAAEALEQYGVGSGASRLVTGNHPLFSALESRLAALKQTEDCVVFGSGYLANLGIVPTLVGSEDLVLADELSHACLLAGTKLSGATSHIFRHNDLAHLGALLSAHRKEHRHCLILTDGVFSMDGDLAPLSDLSCLADAHTAWLMSDDAHGIGVLGDGRGSSFIGGRKANVPLQMGTLSKAVGSYGGYLCAAQPVIDLIKTRARTLIYSTGLPPASVAASLAALDVIQANPDLCGQPVRKARQFTDQLGLPKAQSPIVPVIIGDAAKTLSASKRLEDAGFLVTAIRPPTVPEGTARLRITFTAAHTDADIAGLADAVRNEIFAAAWRVRTRKRSTA